MTILFHSEAASGDEYKIEVDMFDEAERAECPYAVVKSHPRETSELVLTRPEAVSLYRQLRLALQHDPNIHQGSLQ